MLLGRDFLGIAPPVITGDETYPEWREQGQQFPTCRIGSGTKGVGHNPLSLGIEGIPEPMAIALVAHKGPLLIELADKRDIIQYGLLRGYLPRGEFFRARKTVLMPILRTRAVSRTPVPLKAMSTILSLTLGLRAS